MTLFAHIPTGPLESFISLVVWFILTVSALIVGVLGIVVGSRRPPRRRRAAGLGLAACLLELLGGAFVWLCFLELQAKLGARAEEYRPGRYFWGISILTLFLGSLALGLGGWRGRTLAAKKDGGGEL
jgi:hypothetical protein